MFEAFLIWTWASGHAADNVKSLGLRRDGVFGETKGMLRSGDKVGADVTEVFVSYKSEDRARVAPLVAALEADGVGVW
jgi:hypothetical protein